MLDGKVLGDAIAEAITSPNAPAEQRAQIKALWETIGNVIVTHIKGAEIIVEAGIPVSTTGSMGPSTGATTAAGSGTIS